MFSRYDFVVIRFRNTAWKLQILLLWKAYLSYVTWDIGAVDADPLVKTGGRGRRIQVQGQPQQLKLSFEIKNKKGFSDKVHLGPKQKTKNKNLKIL